MKNKVFSTFIFLVIAFIAIYAPNFHQTDASPIRFMCDMCESNWLHCMMKCHMEMYMTRHHYDKNNVYKGRPKHRPRKNHLDMMFEHFMHKTGHDHMK